MTMFHVFATNKLSFRIYCQTVQNKNCQDTHHFDSQMLVDLYNFMCQNGEKENKTASYFCVWAGIQYCFQFKSWILVIFQKSTCLKNNDVYKKTWYWVGPLCVTSVLTVDLCLTYQLIIVAGSQFVRETCFFIFPFNILRPPIFHSLTLPLQDL